MALERERSQDFSPRFVVASVSVMNSSAFHVIATHFSAGKWVVTSMANTGA